MWSHEDNRNGNWSSYKANYQQSEWGAVLDSHCYGLATDGTSDVDNKRLLVLLILYLHAKY